jgi:hypothetical protein
MSDILCMSQVMYMYICVGYIDFASVSKIFLLDLELPRLCNICLLSLNHKY